MSCTYSGCGRVDVRAGFCLNHLPKKTPSEVNDFTSYVGRQIEDKSSGQSDFIGFVFPAGYQIRERQIVKRVNFSKPVFEGNTLFERVSFQGGVAFDEATFTGKLQVKDTSFGTGSADVTTTATFTKAQFDEVIFEQVRFNDFHFDNSTCQVTSLNIGEGFVLESSKGPANTTEIFLDQQLTKVVTVRNFTLVNYSDNSSPDRNWSGYELWWSGYPLVYRATMQYTLPTVSPPQQGCDQFWYGCDLSIWTGLEGSLGGLNTFIAQTGSDEQIHFGVYNNFLWYEFVGNGGSGPNSCSGYPVPGDKIVSQTLNEAANGGSSSYYDVMTVDNSQGFGCTPPRYYWPQASQPYYADFMAERITGPNPYPVGSIWTLVQFSLFSMRQASMQYNGASFSIYQSYQNGFYQRDYIRSGSFPGPYTNNTHVGNVICGTCSGFAEQWLTSQGADNGN